MSGSSEAVDDEYGACFGGGANVLGGNNMGLEVSARDGQGCGSGVVRGGEFQVETNV